LVPLANGKVRNNLSLFLFTTNSSYFYLLHNTDSNLVSISAVDPDSDWVRIQ
jgi:hypothetical protein